jgi:hypothetical protein
VYKPNGNAMFALACRLKKCISSLVRAKVFSGGLGAQKRAAIFAISLAPVFTTIAYFQTFMVRHEAWSAIRKEVDGWANDIGAEIGYTNDWNLKGYRNASIVAPGWYVIASNGLVIDIEGYIPGIFNSATLPYNSVFHEPSTINSEIGESWRLLAKRINGGTLMVGIPTSSNSVSLDFKLKDTIEAFPTNIDEAAKVRSRNVDADIDYAILRDSGELICAWGGIPLKLDRSFLRHFANPETRTGANGKSYAIFSRLIKDSNDGVVGLIMIPRDITDLEAALRTDSLFNYSAAGLLWLVVSLCSIPFIHTLLSRQQRLSMLKNLLRKQKLAESGNIEFKPAFQWDSRVMQEDKDLRFDFLLKPVAAFLNASGGTLFIGVNDDGSACGIAGDLALFKDSPNRLELEMMQLISSKIGPIHSGSVRIQIEPLNPTGQDFVCIVDVDAAPRPAFVKWGNSVYFFKRAGNKSEPLGPIDQHDYIQSRWG